MLIRAFISTVFMWACFFLAIFSVLEYQNVSLVFANISQNISWYYGDDMNIKRYNESIWLVEKWEFQQAKSLLLPLLNSKEEYQSDVFELYGDILYRTAWSTGDILTMYHRALGVSWKLRIEKKIALLENKTTEGMQENTKNNTPTNTWKSLSGNLARDIKRSEIEHLQQNRWWSVNLHMTSTSDLKRKMQDVFWVLEWGEVKKDW